MSSLSELHVKRVLDVDIVIRLLPFGPVARTAPQAVGLLPVSSHLGRLQYIYYLPFNLLWSEGRQRVETCPATVQARRLGRARQQYGYRSPLRGNSDVTQPSHRPGSKSAPHIVTPAIHINPDDYLETEGGRVFTAERNALAWERAFADLSLALRGGANPKSLYVVMGVQGAGKTTWVQSNQELLTNSVVFDAALPAKSHRAKVLAIASALGAPAIAVWVNAPLEVALIRNQLRAPDKQIPEAAVRSVFSMLEPPSIEEGFIQVIEVPAHDTRGFSSFNGTAGDAR